MSVAPCVNVRAFEEEGDLGLQLLTFPDFRNTYHLL